MRALGLDVGQSTIGVAMTDEAEIAAHPLRVIARSGTDNDVSAIQTLVAEHDITDAVIGSVVILVALAGWFVHRALAYPDSGHGGSGAEIEVEVKNGMSFPQVATMLAEKGVIARPTWFRLYAMWQGDTTNVKTGKYL